MITRLQKFQQELLHLGDGKSPFDIMDCSGYSQSVEVDISHPNHNVIDLEKTLF